MKLLPIVTWLASIATFTAAQQVSNNGIGTSPTQRGIVNATQAQAAIQGAVEAGNSINVSNNIAIVDPFGLLVAFLRQDNAFPGILRNRSMLCNC